MDLIDQTGSTQTVRTALPGDVVCATAVVDGVRWVFVDPAKPDADLHLAELLRG